MREDTIKEIYNNMADEYDDIHDLWYGWLLAMTHLNIVQFLDKVNINKKGKLNCLDVGCGTGFQSILYSLCGFKVTGIDISDKLLLKAKSKFPEINEYSKKAINLANEIKSSNTIQHPEYQQCSAVSLPYDDNTFDIVNCCGSVLSSIENYEVAIKEMVRVLKPKGYLILEAENKYNMDLFWPIIDKLLLGQLEYDIPLSTSLKNLFSKPSKHVQIVYPFSTHESEVKIPIRLFSSFMLKKEMRLNSIEIIDIKSIHNFTNIIPSVFLDSISPSKFLLYLFRILSKFEKKMDKTILSRHFGCSTMYFGIKK
jgi:ubiquinone/menaquinone biosynthesis C-methylase UbiE